SCGCLDAVQQGIEIERGAAPDVGAAGGKESVCGRSALVAQYAEKRPLRIELGGVTKLAESLARNAVDAHAGPQRALAIAGIGHLAEQRDHAQFLEQHAVEGDLVEAIENVACGARRAVPMHRIDLNQNRV